MTPSPHIRKRKSDFVHRQRHVESRAVLRRMGLPLASTGPTAQRTNAITDYTTRITGSMATVLKSLPDPIDAVTDKTIDSASGLRTGWHALFDGTIHKALPGILPKRMFPDLKAPEVVPAVPAAPPEKKPKPEAENIPDAGENKKRREPRPKVEPPVVDAKQFSAIGKAWVDAINQKSEARANNKPKKPLRPLK